MQKKSIRAAPDGHNIGVIKMATTLTLRLYRNEYNSNFVRQIENNCIDGLTAVDGNNDVVFIQGDITLLEQLQGLMYTDDENTIQAVFPSFRPIAEIEANIDSEYEIAFLQLQGHLLSAINAAKNTTFKLHTNKRYETLYKCFELMNDRNK